MIDLSEHYNAALTEDWHGNGGNNLSELPVGVRTYGGVDFDVRGIVQLRFRNAPERFPEAVNGINIGTQCRRIHLLHSTGWGNGSAGTLIGRYVIHYANGQTHEIPIKLGDDVWDWHFNPNESKPTKNSVVAWTGSNAVSRLADNGIQLFRATWENPLLDVGVRSIDYVSAQAGAGPFLIAITVETAP